MSLVDYDVDCAKSSWTQINLRRSFNRDFNFNDLLYIELQDLYIIHNIYYLLPF